MSNTNLTLFISKNRHKPLMCKSKCFKAGIPSFNFVIFCYRPETLDNPSLVNMKAFSVLTPCWLLPRHRFIRGLVDWWVWKKTVSSTAIDALLAIHHWCIAGNPPLMHCWQSTMKTHRSNQPWRLASLTDLRWAQKKETNIHHLQEIVMKNIYTKKTAWKNLPGLLPRDL